VTTTGLIKPSRPMVDCSLPDILRSAADTFQHFGSTEALSYPLSSEGYTRTRLAKVLLWEGQADCARSFRRSIGPQTVALLCE